MTGMQACLDPGPCDVQVININGPARGPRNPLAGDACGGLFSVVEGG
jgi:hypothetical protein